MERFWINRRYRFERELGEGAMARVYLGRDQVLDRDIAIKVLHPGIAVSSDTRARFDREVQSAARLSHPHIVDVYNVGDHDGLPYIIMEYVQGETLQQIIDQEAPFPPDDVAALIEQVAAALDHAHDRGVIHRDVKPQNIIVDRNGVAKIVDFGIAGGLEDPLTAIGGDLGTPNYMAPEVLSGQPPTRASDVYALGIVAYEMLTGQLPFRGGTASALAIEHVNAEPIAPSRINSAVPPQCDTIVLQALAKHPTRRTASAGQFATRLTNWRLAATTSPPPLHQPQRALSDMTTELGLPAAQRHPLPLETETHSAASPRRAARPRYSRRSSGPLPWLGSFGLVAALLFALVFLNSGDGLSSSFGGNAWNPFRDADPTPSVTDAADPPDQPAPEAGGQSVPDVRGLSVEAARAVLAEHGLQLREDPAVFSSRMSAGAVAEQDPPAGSALGFGETVFIKTSRGPAETNLNDLALRGRSAEFAHARLSELGLKVQREERGSRTAPSGTVIEVESPTAAAAGDTVTLVVSIGDKVEVPRETFGTSVDDAAADLRATGLNVADPIGVDRTTIERAIDLAQFDIAPGDVVGVQNADGSANFGAWLERGATVTLVYYDPALD